MVLRCPQCSELKFFGRTQVLGELVVCPERGGHRPVRGRRLTAGRAPLRAEATQTMTHKESRP